MKKLHHIRLAILALFSIVLVACSQQGAQQQSSATSSSTAESSSQAPVVVKVGVVGENNEVWEFVKEKLAKENITIELVRFTDYNQPNDALVSKELDLNSFQHRIFLESYNADKGTDLTPIGDTVIAPLGIYSEKIQEVSQIGEGDTIAIPNDVTNGGRALLLLQTAGLIKVDPTKGQKPTVSDITENPLNIQILELDASQTARALSEVTASVINSGMAVDAGFVPTEDAFYLEPVNESSQPYVNIIVARSEDKDNEVYKKVVQAYQSEDTKQVIAETSKGSSIPAWE